MQCELRTNQANSGAVFFTKRGIEVALGTDKGPQCRSVLPVLAKMCERSLTMWIKKSPKEKKKGDEKLKMTRQKLKKSSG